MNRLTDYEESDSDAEEDGSDHPRKKAKIVTENNTLTNTAASSFFGDLFASHQPTVEVD